MAGNFSQELAKQSPVLRQALDRNFDQLQTYYTTCLATAQAMGEIDGNADSNC